MRDGAAPEDEPEPGAAPRRDQFGVGHTASGGTCTGIQVCRYTGTQVYRYTGYPNFGRSVLGEVEANFRD